MPRVFDFPLCETLIKFYDKLGGEESGFCSTSTGRPRVWSIIASNGAVISPSPIRYCAEAIRDQIVRRLVPAIGQFFQFQATRIDRYIVACYDSAVGGHFYRHRDNVNVGAQHRRFAVTVNLNRDYQGCDMVLRNSAAALIARRWAAPWCSCGALHQVTPVTSGRRYAFLAFLYGEADAALREVKNARSSDRGAICRGIGPAVSGDSRCGAGTGAARGLTRLSTSQRLVRRGFAVRIIGTSGMKFPP